MSEPVVIPKNKRESYRLGWAEYAGHRYLDLRIYYDPGDGELRPTGKGVAIMPAALPDIVQALQRLGGAA